MPGWSSSLFGLHSSDPLKDTFCFIRVTEQYENPNIQNSCSLIPQDIIEPYKVISSLFNPQLTTKTATIAIGI